MKLSQYQKEAVRFVIDKRKVGLFMDMGLGKTITSLTSALVLIDREVVNKVLIIAPLAVARTVWKQEVEKWDHTKSLKVSICTGSPKQRLKALSDPTCNVFVVSVNCSEWLVKNNLFNFDMLIVDESSQFKSYKSKRFKSFQKVVGSLKSVVLLSGTPSPKSLSDLWSQIYLLDEGARLGRNITEFRRRYCRAHEYNKSWTVIPEKEILIKEAIKDITMYMRASDHIEVGEVRNIKVPVVLPDSVTKAYKLLEKKFFVEWKDENLTCDSAGVMANKLLQWCNGSCYNELGDIIHIHDEKLNALADILDGNPTETFLLAYNFKFDRISIHKRFPFAVDLTHENVDEWNSGKIRLAIAHPASVGYGLNLQKGGRCVIWYGLNWSLELYRQFVARLARQGQKHMVRVVHLVVQGGMDNKVLKALDSKAKTQDEFLEYIKFKG